MKDVPKDFDEQFKEIAMQVKGQTIFTSANAFKKVKEGEELLL